MVPVETGPDVRPSDRAVSALDAWTRTDYLCSNLDDLVKKRGMGIYDKMLTDPQVYAISEVKKLAILSPGWDIVPASLSNKDVAIADFVTWSLTRIPGAFTETLFSILTAMDYGFSITEKLWYKINDSKLYDGLIGVRNLKPKAPHTFNFDMDKYGNMKPKGLVQPMNDEDHYLSYKKFIHFAYNSRFGNPYGRADLRAAYRPWIEKAVISRFWNIFLERYGSPIIVVEVPNTATDDEISDIQMITRNLQAKSAITVPEGFKFDTIEAQRTGSANYDMAVHSKNMDIARAILMPDLLGFSGGAHVGSFALGKTHADLFNMVVETVSTWLETLINEQLVRELVDYNFTVRDYPRFRFDPIKRENRSVRAKLVALLIQAQIIHPAETWIRGFIEIPVEGTSGTKEEESRDDPVLGKKLDEIKKILEAPKPTVESVRGNNPGQEIADAGQRKD